MPRRSVSVAFPPEPSPRRLTASGGTEAPPLLLLPGTLCDARLFAPVLQRLRRSATIGAMTGANSAFDLAGQILSAAPPRFALAGFSLGGIVALEIAARAPGRVAGLALLDTTARPDPVDNAARRRATLARAREVGIDTVVLDAWPRLVAPANHRQSALRETLLAMARDGGVDTLASQTDVAIGRADGRPRLGAIEVPTLVLAGEHEAVCPLDAHREMADAIAGARLRLVPDAGHFALLENPGAVADALADWLAVVDASQARKVAS